MKKLIAMACLLGSSVALSACGTSNSTGYVDTQPPYAEERTAGGATVAAPERRVEVRSAEPVFERRVVK